MGGADDELEALRSRAYGPEADIHLDPGAVRRLEQLEAERRPKRPPAEAPAEPAAVPAVEAPPAADDEPEPEHPLLPLLRSLAGRLSRVRRSTVLIVVGAVALATAVTTALVLVERVQGDPLQTGAVQIARLSVDNGYEVPVFFQSRVEEGPVLGFEEFHGLRAVVGAGGYLSMGSDDRCLYIYSVDSGNQSSEGTFSGPLLGGCAVGGFPAMTQFRSDIVGFPKEFRDGFPDPTALQFVYDPDHEEIVVFTDK